MCKRKVVRKSARTRIETSMHSFNPKDRANKKEKNERSEIMKPNLSSQSQSWKKVHFKNSKVTILRHLIGI